MHYLLFKTRRYNAKHNGKPYDTLDEVIGIAENPSSLKSFGVKYEQIDLINDDFDYEK